jgi:serine/threonine-protein kinase HipA
MLGREFNDCLRLSIAGAQEKTALLWHEGQWLIPHGSTPTTHIFKLPLGHIGIDRRLDLSSSVENEWLCLRILQAYGLNVPKAAMLRFEDQKVLVVERFDRELHKSARWWLRLPQEDFCQVTATPSLLKYESEGGPGMARIANYLQSSQHAERDLADFFKVQVLFWMLAATDGHAKNFSIRLLRGGRYHLTAFYDVLSAWPIIGKTAGRIARQKVKLAMSVKGKRRHYNLDTIRRDHFEKMAEHFGLGTEGRVLIDQLIEQTPNVIQTVCQGLPQDYPRKLLDAICHNLFEASKRLRVGGSN